MLIYTTNVHWEKLFFTEKGIHSPPKAIWKPENLILSNILIKKH